MDLEILEERIIRMNQDELNTFLFQKNLFLREQTCNGSCGRPLKYEKCTNYVDKYCWRCTYKECTNYQQRISIRKGSHFENFGKDMKKFLKVLIRYSARQCQHSILSTVGISKPTLRKLFKTITSKMKFENEQARKLGGPGTVVQIDETMLNFKCKSHRGRSPENRTDALVIVECSPHISRVWAEVIPNKQKETILPIICNHVVNGSVIHTDEHRTYRCLNSNGFLHQTVCHKYSFVNQLTGVHTQNVEAFNNVLKTEIKKRMGIKTVNREEFLTEIVWRWNNKENIFNALMDLLKV